MSERITRGEFILWLAGVGLALTACKPLITDTPNPPIWTSLYLKDLNHDPVFRASSLMLFTTQTLGQGCLLDYRGNLYVYTIKHLIESFLEDRQNPLVYIPKIDTFNLDINRFEMGKKKASENDAAALYKVNKDIANRIKDAASKNVITPLIFASTPPSPDELVAISKADSGKNVLYKNLQYNPKSNTYEMIQTGAGVVCAGKNGAPVLKISDRRPTREIYGLVKGVDEDSLTGDSGSVVAVPCYEKILVRPND